MKQLLTLVFTLLALSVYAQKDIKPTDDFTVSGAVKKELTIRLSDLGSFKAQKIKGVKITNHLGEKKGNTGKLSGIPITEILKTLEIDVESPKRLSEFYLVFEASDGYKVVYSWNELFNSETGKNTFLVTQKDGVEAKDFPERMLIITPKDTQTGRRYVKSLARIVVKRG